jgi:hypothetical protein
MTDVQEWEILLKEYQRVRIGPLWIGLVISVCRAIVPRYSPAVFNHGLPWDDSAIGDLAHDVILDRLHGSGQIDYIIASAKCTSSARGLVGLHVKQVLAQRAAPTQRDNVARRLFKLIANSGEPVKTVDGVGYRPVGSYWEPREASDSTLAVAARFISELPRLPNRGTDRFSPLFTTKVLRGVIPSLWDALGCPITLNLLRRVVGRALTGLEPALFHMDVVDEDHPNLVGGLSAEEELLVKELAEQLVGILTAEQREILVNIEHLKDDQLAALLGVSRPTALKRRHLTRDAIVDFFDKTGLQNPSAELKGAILLRAQNLLGGAPA